MRKLINIVSVAMSLLFASSAFALTGGDGISAADRSQGKAERTGPAEKSTPEHNVPERAYYRESNGDVTKVEHNSSGTSITTKSTDGELHTRVEAPDQNRFSEYRSMVERTGGTRLEAPGRQAPAPAEHEPRDFGRGGLH